MLYDGARPNGSRTAGYARLELTATGKFDAAAAAAVTARLRHAEEALSLAVERLRALVVWECDAHVLEVAREVTRAHADLRRALQLVREARELADVFRKAGVTRGA